MTNQDISSGAGAIDKRTVRRRVKWARFAAAAVTVLGVAAVVISWSSSDSAATAANRIAQYIFWASLWAWLGAVIVSKRIGVRIGWMFISIGAGFIVSSIVDVAVARIGAVSEISDPFEWLALWMQSWIWMVWIFPILLLFYVFPTAELLSSRWRWAPILMAVVLGDAVVETTIGPSFQVLESNVVVANPIGFLGQGWVGWTGLAWLAGLFALIVGAGTALVMRYRRADEVERAQLKWLLLTGMVFVIGVSVSLAFSDWAPASVVATIAIAFLPVSITIAVLKYRLYEVDVIISRSLTFGVLAIFIGAVYVGIVVGIGRLLDQTESAGFGLSVAATALVAIGFQPVRHRVERMANRLVFGRRATPYEVLARFSHRDIAESDEDVLARIPQLIVDGTGASSAALWVSSGTGFRIASVWPEDSHAGSVSIDEEFFVPDADVSLPVFHDGNLLGGLSLVAARGGSITPPEMELLQSLAGGLGLTLRNGQLTAALRRQVKDLQRSRDRVVSAADEARRSLEHDLDSGPQQQLVAVKVKLGPIRKLAEQAGALKTAEVLADIETQAGEAIKAVRDFAAGIYPPLLGAEGLAVALGQETRKAALPVDLEAHDIGRYPRDVEAAVYFSILEALQNTAKYAEASRAVVHLRDVDGELQFEVSDNGNGFDPATVRRGAGLDGIGDRIDTIGGTWDIASSPSYGTVVSGSIPVSRHVGAPVGVS